MHLVPRPPDIGFQVAAQRGEILVEVLGAMQLLRAHALAQLRALAILEGHAPPFPPPAIADTRALYDDLGHVVAHGARLISRARFASQSKVQQTRRPIRVSRSFWLAAREKSATHNLPALINPLTFRGQCRTIPRS